MIVTTHIRWLTAACTSNSRASKAYLASLGNEITFRITHANTHAHTHAFLNYYKIKLGVVVHSLNPSIWETEQVALYEFEVA